MEDSIDFCSQSARPSGITLNNLALALRRLRGRAWSWTGLLLEALGWKWEAWESSTEC